jgi:hypothetical protein
MARSVVSVSLDHTIRVLGTESRAGAVGVRPIEHRRQGRFSRIQPQFSSPTGGRILTVAAAIPALTFLELRKMVAQRAAPAHDACRS